MDEQFRIPDGRSDGAVGIDDHGDAVMERFVEATARRDGDRRERSGVEPSAVHARVRATVGHRRRNLILMPVGSTISVR